MSLLSSTPTLESSECSTVFPVPQFKWAQNFPKPVRTPYQRTLSQGLGIWFSGTASLECARSQVQFNPCTTPSQYLLLDKKKWILSIHSVPYNLGTSLLLKVANFQRGNTHSIMDEKKKMLIKEHSKSSKEMGGEAKLRMKRLMYPNHIKKSSLNILYRSRTNLISL